MIFVVISVFVNLSCLNWFHLSFGCSVLIFLMFRISLHELLFFFFFFMQKTAYDILRSDWSSDVCSSDLRFFFFKQKTAYEILRSDWSSDVCSSDLRPPP